MLVGADRGLHRVLPLIALVAMLEGDRYVRSRRPESLLGANELSSDLRRGAKVAPAASV